jgi:hypothetical protein
MHFKRIIVQAVLVCYTGQENKCMEAEDVEALKKGHG